MDKLSVAMAEKGTIKPPKEIYRDLIPDVGGNHTVVPIKAEAIEGWKIAWASGRPGWVLSLIHLCHFVLASAVMQKEQMDAALLAPKQEVGLETSTRNVMSVDIPVFSPVTRTPDPSDIYPYGFAFTSFELDDAVERLSGLLPVMLRLAECEKSARLLAAEIEKTRRRVNALEHVMIPRLQETIRYITMKLEENDRSSRTRLMKVKDMMLEKAHHYSEDS